MPIRGEFEHVGGTDTVNLSAAAMITDAARQAKLVLNTRCAGKGVCGGCAVDLLEGTYLRNGETFRVASGQTTRVLGCQTHVVGGPFRIRVPRRSLVETGEQVVSDFILNTHHELDPTVRTFSVTLPTAELGNPAGDYERLAGDIHKAHGIELSAANLIALRALSVMTKTETVDLTVRIAWRHDDGWELLAVEPAVKDVTTYGVAVDIGTTTVAVALVDIESGKILDTVSGYNQQIQQADDVAARIVAAGSDEGLTDLHRLIVGETLNPMIALLCRKHDLNHRDIFRAVVSGNTVMWHVFLKIDPTPLGQVPFPAVANYPGGFRARDLGLDICPQAIVDIVPSISAYVGGDIVSDIYITRLDRARDGEMVIDVGTNGEIALNVGDEMFVTACAAGPAFEGLRIACGMRAAAGAIERVTIDGSDFECAYEVIGHGRPVGLCGSALIDFLAEAFRAGLVDPAGKFNRGLVGRCSRLREIDGSNMLEYVVATRDRTEDRHRDLTVTEQDLQTLLAAKAAVFSAIVLLARRAGKKLGDLNRIYLAGGFARYLHIENAIAIGLLPEIDPGKYVVVGNGSLAGAFLGLIDRQCWPRFRSLLEKPHVVELNLDPDFQDEYTFALFLPNFQKDLFPETVKAAAEAAP